MILHLFPAYISLNYYHVIERSLESGNSILIDSFNHGLSSVN